MRPEILLGAALLAPLAGAAAIALLRKRPNLREAASIASGLVTLGGIVLLLPAVTAGQAPRITLLEVFPGLPIAFSAEPLGTGFAAIVALLWVVTVIYAIGYMRAQEEGHQARFYLFFALAIATTVAAALADNLLTLYLFYEGLTWATYPLVTHRGRSEDQAAGRTYLRMLLGTSLILMLLAIAWIYSLTGTLTFEQGGILRSGDGLVGGLSPALLTVLFTVFVLGIGKSALMPFHLWLPAAMVAPTPVSALLHAVAVVKLGVFAILKVSIYIFGIDTLTEYGAVWPVQYIAAATLLVAAVRAIGEDNLKRRLAYSTVSQLAYIVLAATFANSWSLLGGGFHVAAHALAKITLFFCAGMFVVSLHVKTVSGMRGLGRAMPVTVGAWVVASLCVIGMPLTGGFWSKLYLARGALGAGEPLLLAVVLLGSLLAMAYLLPPAIQALYRVPSGSAGEAPSIGSREAPLSSLLALTATAALCVLLFFAARPVLRFLESLAG